MTELQPDGAALGALMEWLVAEGLVADDMGQLVAGFCQRLAAAGVPLYRAVIGMPARAPGYASIAVTWSEDGGVERVQHPHGGYDREPFRHSPMRYMIDHRLGGMRRRLEGGNAELDFPVLHELKAEGATDYVGRLRGFSRNFDGLGKLAGLEGIVSTWATRRPGGFDEADIAAIDGVLPTLFLALYRLALSELSAGLMTAYVGADAARRVLMGQTQRGVVERRPAVLLFADLRGFTAFADAHDGEAVVALLDDSFEAIVAPITSAGGEILKFLGDGVLAMWPLGADPVAVCEGALSAATAVLARIDALVGRRRAEGAPALLLDVALHLGTVMYGNVGAEERIDFTVIGPAVNEVARIEALCQALDQHLLCSASFAGHHRGRLVSLGNHELRGVAQKQEIFGLA